jgi:hypothetical protein
VGEGEGLSFQPKSHRRTRNAAAPTPSPLTSSNSFIISGSW